MRVLGQKFNEHGKQCDYSLATLSCSHKECKILSVVYLLMLQSVPIDSVTLDVGSYYVLIGLPN